jgi:hypothetical protein
VLRGNERVQCGHELESLDVGVVLLTLNVYGADCSVVGEEWFLPLILWMEGGLWMMKFLKYGLVGLRDTSLRCHQI